ncbi:hypothetical protein Tco_0375315 [Tanacetum coccineum]
MLPFTRSTTPRATLLQPPNLLTIFSQPPKAAFGFSGTQKGAFVVRASGCTLSSRRKSMGHCVKLVVLRLIDRHEGVYRLKERPATPEPAWTIPSSNKSDVVNNWASALATNYEPPAENSLLAKIEDMKTFMNWYCQKVNKIVLTQADFEGHAYEVVKAFYPDVIHLQFQMEECHKMITAQLFFNKDLEYLRYGSKGSNHALSISKMKAASYPDFGLELLVPEQMWIDDVCTYDISAKYGIFSTGVLSIEVYIGQDMISCVEKMSEHTCGFSVS